MKHRPCDVPVITICGSYKFSEGMKQAQHDLMEDGCIVFMPVDLEYPEDSGYHKNMTVQEIHDRHDQKMLMSDLIFVYNLGGFIGEHTQREIDFAKEHNISIKYLEDPNDVSYAKVERGNLEEDGFKKSIAGKELRCSNCGCLIPDKSNIGSTCPNCDSVLIDD